MAPNIFGKSFKKIGNVNSINGTIINTEKGTSRNKSAAVRVNYNERILEKNSCFVVLLNTCFRSRRVNV